MLGGVSDLLIMGVEASTLRVDVVVSDLEGAVAGRGRAGSANPNGLPAQEVAAHLAEAVGQALTGLDPLAVRAVVLGTPGILRFQRGESADRLAGLWRETGLACPVTIVADAVTAFAAGTARPSGSVLIAGAGAMAARVEHEQVAVRVDGNGWLVGDDGSGFWLGRQAVRAVFAALEGRDEDTLLRDAVLSTIAQGEPVPAGREECVSLLLDAVYDGPPVALAALAPLVPAAAEAGDRVAHRIVRRAVDLLVDAAEPLVGGDGAGAADSAQAAAEPLVLAGSLMAADGPIRREVRRRLAERHGSEPLLAAPGAGGALWLAARRIERGFGPSAHRLFTTLGSDC
jgi:N-acetylglucosamine kinase-like BadF-type ATPase